MNCSVGLCSQIGCGVMTGKQRSGIGKLGIFPGRGFGLAVGRMKVHGLMVIIFSYAPTWSLPFMMTLTTLISSSSGNLPAIEYSFEPKT